MIILNIGLETSIKAKSCYQIKDNVTLYYFQMILENTLNVKSNIFLFRFIIFSTFQKIQWKTADLNQFKFMSFFQFVDSLP